MSDLAKALAEFQLTLPKIAKGETAKIRSDKGNFEYSYADLSDVSSVVLPLLAEHGLSFTAAPTYDDQGRFVLRYQLLHMSGESIEGLYPLPNGQPQQVGSAITYARRYCLCAVTGVAPADEDDDGRAAQQARPQPAAKPAKETTAVKVRAAAKEHGLIEQVGAYLHEEHGTGSLDEIDQEAQERLLGLLSDEAGREYLSKAAS